MPDGNPIEQPPLQPELPPEIPTQPPNLPEGPTPSRKGGWKWAFASVIVIAVVAGGIFIYGGNPAEPNHSGPTAAFVLDGIDTPTGWFLLVESDTPENATGLLEGKFSLIQKRENDAGDLSSVFSNAWLFDNSSNAKAFEEALLNKTAVGNYTSLPTGDLEGCNGILRPFPAGGDWAFIICRDGNLVWEIDSRSTIRAARLYAPMFANEMMNKIKGG